MTVLENAETLEFLRKERSRGVSLKHLASLYGVSWQKIDKLVRNGSQKERRSETLGNISLICENLEIPKSCSRFRTLLSKNEKMIQWVERYRPETLDNMLLPKRIVKVLKNLVLNPRSCALLLSGASGTGKTSTAYAIARSLGCDPQGGEFGGVMTVDSGSQNAESIRDLIARMNYASLSPSGWKVFILNETDKMSQQAEAIWLDKLESLPKKCIAIFTTNYRSKIPGRFRSRCLELDFDMTLEESLEFAIPLGSGIWRHETGKDIETNTLKSAIQKSIENNQLNFRKLIQELEISHLGE